MTHRQALEKAHAEYEKYRKKQDALLSPVEKHYLKSVRALEELKTNKH